MDLLRVSGGGGVHLKKSAYSSRFFSTYVPNFFTACNRATKTSNTNAVVQNRCTAQRGTSVASTPQRDYCFTCTLPVATWLLLFCRRLRLLSSTPVFPRVSLRSFVVLLSAALLIRTPATYAPELHILSSVNSFAGKTVLPSFLLASAMGKVSAVRGGDYKFLRRSHDQYLSSTSFRNNNSHGEEAPISSETEKPGLVPDDTRLWHQSGRRLAASDQGTSDDMAPGNKAPKNASSDVNPQSSRGAAGADPSPPTSRSIPIDGDDASRQQRTDAAGSPPALQSVYDDDDDDDTDFIDAFPRTRRCASFSHGSPHRNGGAAGSPYPLTFHGNTHPQRKGKNVSLWEGDTPPASVAQNPSDPFSRDELPSDFAMQFQALLRDKPHSVAETLWNQVPATERSAFNEMRKRNMENSPGKRGNGSSVRPRPDTRLAAAGEESPSHRQQRWSLTDLKNGDFWGTAGAIPQDQPAPRPRKQGGTKLHGSLPSGRRKATGASSKRAPIELLFTPPRQQQAKVPDEVVASAERVTDEDGEGARPPQSARVPNIVLSDVSGPPLPPENLSLGRDAGDSYWDILQRVPGPSSLSDETERPSISSDYSADSEGDDDSDIPPSRRPSGGGDDRPLEAQSMQTLEDRRPATPAAEGCDGKASKSFINRLFGTYYSYLIRDVRLRRQFALLVLSSIEWPMYTQPARWHRPQVDKWFSHLLTLVNETLSLEEECSLGTILREEITELRWIIRSVDDFHRFLRGQSKVDVHLKEMLMYVPDHRLALNLRPEVLKEVYKEVTSLQLIYYYLSELNSPLETSLLQWNFIHEVRLRWSVLQLLGITHQLVTWKPLTGVLILQVDKIDTQEEQVIRLFDSEENRSTQEALMRFETTVTSALTMRIQMVAEHFKKIFSTSHSEYNTEFQLPKCQVTAFYLKPESSKKGKSPKFQTATGGEDSTNPSGASAAGSEAIETGLFGFEIDVNIAKDLKDRLPRGSMYIQLSLVDPWNYVPEYKPPSDDPSVIPAYRATQILKANLEHDPSLVRVGITKVIYTTIVDAYNSSAPNQTGYDNDRHLVFGVPMQEFKSEESFLAGLIGMVSVPPIQNAAPGTLNPHRIKVIGSARRLPQGEILKTGNFLSGIDYRRHKSIEAMIEPVTVAVHVFLEGLKEKNANSVFELPASTIFDRVVRRGRSKFTVMHSEVVPKKTPTGGQGRTLGQRSGGYPAWVLVVSNLCVAVFFLIVLASLLLNRHAKLPWWVACICGPQNPFAPESENRRDFVAEHAETIGTISKKRAMFFARSRSMLVSGFGARKSEWDKWDADQQTKSTVDGPEFVDSGSENHPASGHGRNSTSFREGSQRRSFGAAVAPLSRRGSLYFGGRGIQHRQQTDQLTNMPPDDVEPSSGKATASSTVPTLSAVPAGSTDIIVTTGSGIRKHRSGSACTEEIGTREIRAATGVMHHRERSVPPYEKVLPARSGIQQSLSSPGSSPAPLRTLELAKSYRRERKAYPVVAYPHQQYAQASGRRSSFSHRRTNAGDGGVRHSNRAFGRHSETRRPQNGRPSFNSSSNAGCEYIAPAEVRNVRAVRLADSPGPSVDECCEVASSGGARGPGGVV